VSSSMWMWIVMEKHYTGCQHSMPSEWLYIVFLAFQNTFLTLLWPLVAWIPPSAPLSGPRKPFFGQTVFV
jgi:hypothetical protein